MEEMVVQESLSKAESKLSCFVGKVCSMKKIIMGSFAVKCKKMSSAQIAQPFLFMRKKAVKK